MHFPGMSDEVDDHRSTGRGRGRRQAPAPVAKRRALPEKTINQELKKVLNTLAKMSLSNASQLRAVRSILISCWLLLANHTLTQTVVEAARTWSTKL